MTSIQPDASLPAHADNSVAGADSRFQRMLDLLERWGERLNPILVKEARQSLKSRQFGVAFVLVLSCCWLWSIAGLGLTGSDLEFGTDGPSMFMGYFVILAFPLLVIVPFGAFRSLATEREDGTFELLSISTLGAGQIVSGKLGSAIVQMLVYLSAVSPCLAFTYLLRGIDLPTILYITALTCLASLGLSMVALLLATATREKHLQVLLTVVVIGGLLMVFGMGCMLASNILFMPYNFFGGDGSEFWLVNLMLGSAFVSYFVLSFLLARSQLTFASDNRSTAVRICLVAQQLLFTAWFSWIYFSQRGDLEVLTVYMMMVTCHWYVIGVFLTGESPELSPRVRRQLPQSFLGRTFGTWFNPGSGTGLMFAIANVLGAVALSFVCYYGMNLIGFENFRPRRSSRDLSDFFNAAILAPAYLMIYLGLGRLIVLGIRRHFRVEVTLVVCLHVLLLLAGSLTPWLIKISLDSFRYSDFALYEITNPFAVLAEIGGPQRLASERLLVMALVSGLALLVFGFNLPSIAAEVGKVRLARPARVLEEDAALRPATPEQPTYVSPFDD